MKYRPIDEPIELEIRTWTEAGPYGVGAVIRSRVLYKNTGFEATGPAIEALHERALATGYFVKARMAHLDTCRLRGLPYGGVVKSIEDGTVTVLDPDRNLEGQVEKDLFVTLYEVD